MSTRRADELLYDSEATLRLVDLLLDELCASDMESAGAVSSAPKAPAGTPPPPTSLKSDLPRIVVRTHTEITAILEALRQSRDPLDQTALAEVECRLAELARAFESMLGST